MTYIGPGCGKFGAERASNLSSQQKEPSASGTATWSGRSTRRARSRWRRPARRPRKAIEIAGRAADAERAIWPPRCYARHLPPILAPPSVTLVTALSQRSRSVPSQPAAKAVAWPDAALGAGLPVRTGHDPRVHGTALAPKLDASTSRDCGLHAHVHVCVYVTVCLAYAPRAKILTKLARNAPAHPRARPRAPSDSSQNRTGTPSTRRVAVTR